MFWGIMHGRIERNSIKTFSLWTAIISVVNDQINKKSLLF
jgi:hypothetical protein